MPGKGNRWWCRVSAMRQELHVAVSVSDDGGGIPAERLPHLFRKFSRIDAEQQGGDNSIIRTQRTALGTVNHHPLSAFSHASVHGFGRQPSRQVGKPRPVAILV